MIRTLLVLKSITPPFLSIIELITKNAIKKGNLSLTQTNKKINLFYNGQQKYKGKAARPIINGVLMEDTLHLRQEGKETKWRSFIY